MSALQAVLRTALRLGVNDLGANGRLAEESLLRITRQPRESSDPRTFFAVVIFHDVKDSPYVCDAVQLDYNRTCRHKCSVLISQERLCGATFQSDVVELS